MSYEDRCVLIEYQEMIFNKKIAEFIKEYTIIDIQEERDDTHTNIKLYENCLYYIIKKYFQ